SLVSCSRIALERVGGVSWAHPSCGPGGSAVGTVGCRCGLLLPGSLELVGKLAGFAGHEIGAWSVVCLDRVPVIDLQPDVALAQRDLLCFERQPTLLLGEQLDLLTSRHRSELPVRHVL